MQPTLCALTRIYMPGDILDQASKGFGRALLTADPLVEVLVIFVQQRLIKVQLGRAHTGKTGLRVAHQNHVHLFDPAPHGAHLEAFQPCLMGFAHSVHPSAKALFKSTQAVRCAQTALLEINDLSDNLIHVFFFTRLRLLQVNALAQPFDQPAH